MRMPLLRQSPLGERGDAPQSAQLNRKRAPAERGTRPSRERDAPQPREGRVPAGSLCTPETPPVSRPSSPRRSASATALQGGPASGGRVSESGGLFTWARGRSDGCAALRLIAALSQGVVRGGSSDGAGGECGRRGVVEGAGGAGAEMGGGALRLRSGRRRRQRSGCQGRGAVKGLREAWPDREARTAGRPGRRGDGWPRLFELAGRRRWRRGGPGPAAP